MNPYELRNPFSGGAEELKSRPVNTAAMVNLVHEHDGLFAKDLVEHSVIPDPNPEDVFSLPWSFTAPRGNGSSRSSQPLHNPGLRRLF
jgi:hypothetical protein